jgi:hypothetical protein
VALSFALGACGTGSSSHLPENQLDVNKLPDCNFKTADFSRLAGSYATLDEATQSLMDWVVTIELKNNCKVNSETLGQSLGERLNLSTSPTGQVDVILNKGDQK